MYVYTSESNSMYCTIKQLYNKLIFNEFKNKAQGLVLTL